MLQRNGRLSMAVLAEATGLPLSTVADRVKRLQASGAIRDWRAVLDPLRFEAAMCAFVFVDMRHEGEADAVAALAARGEVLEIHHVSGAHSYLLKLRIADMAAMQAFLAEVIKPLPAVTRTETVFSLDAVKETSVIAVPGVAP